MISFFSLISTSCGVFCVFPLTLTSVFWLTLDFHLFFVNRHSIFLLIWVFYAHLLFKTHKNSYNVSKRQKNALKGVLVPFKAFYHSLKVLSKTIFSDYPSFFVSNTDFRVAPNLKTCFNRI